MIIFVAERWNVQTPLQKPILRRCAANCVGNIRQGKRDMQRSISLDEKRSTLQRPRYRRTAFLGSVALCSAALHLLPSHLPP